jgi:type II secretory pathway component PulJ
VALAAIQGLNQKLEQRLEQKETEITELKARLTTLEKLITQLSPKTIQP